MHRIGRASIAMLLSFAFAGAPVIVEQCLASCEAAHVAATDSSAHARHHQAPMSQSSIGQTTTACGHDHNGIAGVASAVDRAPAKALMSAVAVLVSASPSVAFVSVPASSLHSSGSSGTALHAVSSPIRT